jgi:hypothetical protein
MTMKLLDTIVSAARRALLGISAEEIRYTFEDVRAEIRAVRAELREEMEQLRRERPARSGGEDRPAGPETPVAEA